MRKPRNKSPSSADASPFDQSGPQSGPQGDSWDKVAVWYDSLAADRGMDFHQELIVPGVLRLLELKKGESVLDLACGQGVVSRALYQSGAQVSGVDLSPRLIEMARQRSSKKIRYKVADIRNPGFAPDEAFDAVTLVLAVQNVEPIGPVFAQCARLLRPGGRLVLVLTHPAFRIPRQSGWRWDEEQKLLFRRVDRYLGTLKVPIDMRPFKTPGRKVTWTYHRPLQAYINGLAAVGLWTNALEEWPSPRVSQPGPSARAENRARAEFPLFLAVRAVRVPEALPAVGDSQQVPAGES